MKKNKVNPQELLKLLSAHDLQMYDLCKICGVSGNTAIRWVKNGIPEPQFRLVKLSLGDLR